MKKMLALVMALAMTFSMAAFGQAEEITPPKKPLRYSLGTSSSGGNFYLVGGGIATVLNNALPDFFVMTAEETRRLHREPHPHSERRGGGRRQHDLGDCPKPSRAKPIGLAARWTRFAAWSRSIRPT